jgi:hypothetical protein
VPVSWIDSGVMHVNKQDDTDWVDLRVRVDTKPGPSKLAKISLVQVRHEDVNKSFHAFAKITEARLFTNLPAHPQTVHVNDFTWFFHYTGNEHAMDVSFHLEVNSCEATAVWEVIHMTD